MLSCYCKGGEDMQIQPNSIIKLCSGVPIDSSYKDTIYFESRSAQKTYFESKVSKTMDKASFQRINGQQGVVRMSANAESIYNCNYMMFQNTNYASKWFYAFITNIEYVNDKVSNVYFTIDVMQTWFLFDCTLKECFVEREHSSIDYTGSNIVSENIDTGPIVCNAISKSGHFDSYSAVIATTFAEEGTKTGGYQGGLFTGVDYIAGRVDNDGQVQRLLTYLDTATQANKQDSIVNIFLMPSDFYTTTALPSVQVNSVAKNTTIGGYTPKNKKLLTYPFNYLAVDCCDNSAIYRYEWFIKNTCDFALYGSVVGNPQIALVPMGYNGTNADEGNYSEKLVMSDFPQVAWTVDAYKAWLAQSASKLTMSALLNTGTVAAGMSSFNPELSLSGATGLVENGIDAMLAYSKPPQTRGNNSGSIDVATRNKDFYFKQMQVTPQYAHIIDEYFDKYGYATKRVKVPNIKSRPHWNYAKTQNCCITGNGCNNNDITEIKNIFNNGITFWKNASEIGNYSLDNSPS